MLKKLLIILCALFIYIPCVQGAYNVELEDDAYVSDSVYFAPVSTWENVEAQTINLDKGKILFYIGRENKPEKIQAEVMPVNATDKTLTYKTENSSVATVDENGVVTAGKNIGETYIDIQSGKAMAKMKVCVVKGVESVALSQDSMTLYADKPVTAQLSAVIAPEDATIKDVKWHSKNESIAAVDNDGLVSPCGVGKTEIYAVTDDGGMTAKCTVTVTTWDKRREEIPVVYTNYDMTVDEMVTAQMSAEPTIFTTEALTADEQSVEQYVDPANLVSGDEKYQFINLASQNNVDAETLDTYLKGKGILSGYGSVFKDAAEENGISEVYLVIHACLETGNGTSRLANGTEYNGETVYNVFGIGAVDAAPVAGGTEYAYIEDWTSVEKAIRGGAQWISENYINNSKYSQNTLYKMRWNPDKPAVHQYATDVGWASKQARNMSAMFEAFPNAKYQFEIPVYVGQEKLKIK